MKENKKIVLLVGIALVLTILTITLASAEFWACFNKGDIVHYCNDYKDPWTCGDDDGCEKCMSVYNEIEDCYVHGVWGNCYTLPPATCSGDTDYSLDQQAPDLTVNNPLINGVYNKRVVLLDIEVNELSSLTYIDNIYGRGRWSNLCIGCLGYNHTRSFREGLNNITIKAQDLAGNQNFTEVSFFVDSKKPRLYKPLPKKGFAGKNTEFEIQYKEDNPKELTITYGNDITGYSNAQVNLEDCYEERSKMNCKISVDLSDYDEEEIQYWFNLTDIADNYAATKPVSLNVDLTDPVINNNIQDDLIINGRYVTLLLNITEKNFDEAFYTYTDRYGRLKQKRLCSRLDDFDELTGEGICEKRQTFSYGTNDITIQVSDEAGNSVATGVQVVIA